jgi:endonuclease-3
MGGRPRRDPGSRLDSILEVLQDTWGHATCELDFENAYQLTVATILSAQSTDKLVNTVTPRLFSRYPTPAALAQADLADVEAIVHPTGFFRQKAKNIVNMARRVVEAFDGEIPRTMEEMVTLPGVARKTANVVLGTAYGIPSGIVVDTHVKRVSRRLHLTSESDPVKIERDLMERVSDERWISLGHQLIWQGRRLCHARVPACDRCPLAPLCPETTV